MKKLTLVTFCGKGFFVELPVDEKGKVRVTYPMAYAATSIKYDGDRVVWFG